MSQTLYTLAECYADGSKLTEETSVKINADSKAQVVETVAKGFAGVSPGAKMMTISVENAAPSAALEFDPGRYTGELRVIELTIFASGKTLSTKGFIVSWSLSHGVNSSSSLSFEFVGEYATFQ